MGFTAYLNSAWITLKIDPSKAMRMAQGTLLFDVIIIFVKWNQKLNYNVQAA